MRLAESSQGEPQPGGETRRGPRGTPECRQRAGAREAEKDSPEREREEQSEADGTRAQSLCTGRGPACQISQKNPVKEEQRWPGHLALGLPWVAVARAASVECWGH